MSKEVLSAEQIKAVEDVISTDQAGLSETREKLIEEAKVRSGLEGAVFDEILDSLKIVVWGNDEVGGVSFKVRGHTIELPREMLTIITNIDTHLEVDGKKVSVEQGVALKDKYRTVILDILRISNSKIGKDYMDSVVEDLLK